jgi:translation initiation factor IF-1
MSCFTTPVPTVSLEGANMAKEEDIELEGVVRDSHKDAFTVELLNVGDSKDGSLMTIQAYLAGKLRKNQIKVVIGDKVKVAVSPYDLTRGRITYRIK